MPYRAASVGLHTHIQEKNMEPTTDYESYEDVPVYRKRWFFGLFVLVFMPVSIIILLTGNTYACKNGRVFPHIYGTKNRIITIIALLLLIFTGILRVMSS